jgi:hypothetical protein
VSGSAGDEQPNSSPAEPNAHETCEACGQVTSPTKDRDGRLPGQWASRYPDPDATKQICREAWYVGFSFFFYLALIALVGYASRNPVHESDPHIVSGFAPQALAYLGGSLGGSLFALKWLYHSVAKQQWNIDRRLWRYFTPALSGGAALCVVLLSGSGVLPLFGTDIVRTETGALGISIVLGYFSDRVFSALEGFAKQSMPDSKDPGSGSTSQNAA